MAWTIFAIAPSSEHAPPLYAPLTAQGQVQRCLCFFNGTTSNTHTHPHAHAKHTHTRARAHRESSNAVNSLLSPSSYTHTNSTPLRRP